MARYFIIISLLNLLDGVFTYYGLHNSLIEEENPLMNHLWNIHPFVFLGVKIGLSFLILFIAAFIDKKQLVIKYWKTILIVVSLLYGLVMLMHLCWLFIHFF